MSENIKKKKATHILEDLDVQEVSLVSRPAIGRKYILTKSAVPGLSKDVSEDPEDKPETDTNLAGTPPADVGVETMNEKLLELLKNAELDDKAREAITGALDTILTSEVPEAIMKGFYELAGYEIPKEEVVKEVEVEKIVTVEKAAPADEDKQEEILKGVSDEAKAIFKEQSEKLEAVQKSLEATALKAEEERQLRIGKEFVQKAATEYSELPGTSDELGPVLQAVSEKLSETESKAVVEILNAAKEAIILSKQFEEVGDAGESTGERTTGGEAAYMTKAKAMVKDGEAKTIEQAIAKLVDTTPELFTEDN